MVLRVDYLAKETGNNFRRNPTLTVATVLTVAVSLSLLGASLLIQRGVEGFNTRFKNDVEFIVWMNHDATAENIQTVDTFLRETQTVKTFEYINRQATFTEFQQYYSDQTEVLDLVEPELLPTSFRVVPEIADLLLIQSIGDEIATLPGILAVNYAEEYIQQLNEATSTASSVTFVVAIVSAIASAMLMYNTIRTGLFARRREIEVMRLVGATKWFIRIPFMAEGLLQGVIGAFFSTFALFGLNRVIDRALADKPNLSLFQSFALSSTEVLSVSIILVLVGAALGGIGAGIAVTRYLDA